MNIQSKRAGSVNINKEEDLCCLILILLHVKLGFKYNGDCSWRPLDFPDWWWRRSFLSYYGSKTGGSVSFSVRVRVILNLKTAKMRQVEFSLSSSGRHFSWCRLWRISGIAFFTIKLNKIASPLLILVFPFYFFFLISAFFFSFAASCSFFCRIFLNDSEIRQITETDSLFNIRRVAIKRKRRKADWWEWESFSMINFRVSEVHNETFKLH